MLASTEFSCLSLMQRQMPIPTYHKGSVPPRGNVHSSGSLSWLRLALRGKLERFTTILHGGWRLDRRYRKLE